MMQVQPEPIDVLMELDEEVDNETGKDEKWDVFNLRSTHIGRRSQHGTHREDTITEGGKRRQMAKMLTLILTPIIVLLCVSFYFIADNIIAKVDSDKVRDTILFSVEVGKLVHVMQKERDLSVLYLSSIGPETKTFLTQRYMDTNEQLANLTSWPADLDMFERDYFESKRSFQNYLTLHRSELSLLNLTLYEEISFYSDCIEVFVQWMYNAIKESKYGIIWKTLVAYQKVVVAKEDVGVERALGSAYFSLGGFVSKTIYEWYNQKLHVYRANIRSAVRYSSLVAPIVNARITTGYGNLTDTINQFRNTIQKRELSKPSLKVATWYFDNMTIYIDLLFLVQTDLAKSIIIILDDRANEVTIGVTISSIIILIAAIMCPVLIKTVKSLTNDIQRYARTLVDKTQELNMEKRRLDHLLYQTLPQSVVEKMKQHKDMSAQYYKELSVLFCDLVGFGKICTNSAPGQTVDLLNDLCTFYDEQIGKFDVYKVETLVDCVMVVSGLQQRTRDTHVEEISNLALSIVDSIPKLNFHFVPGNKLNIRIGIDTGASVAGVLGSTRLRYFLFGKTVSSASRIKDSAIANKIHIGAATYRLLTKHGGYITKMKSPLDAKKNQMITYLLVGRTEQTLDDESSTPSPPATTSRSASRHWSPSSHDRRKDQPTGYGLGNLLKNVERSEHK